MDTAALFAVFSETTSQPQPCVAAVATPEVSAGEHQGNEHNVGQASHTKGQGKGRDKQEAKRQIQERNRLENLWYKEWMAMRGRYPRFFRGRIIVQDEKDEGGAYALAFQAAQAAAAHTNTPKDTQVVIFTDASMDPHKQTNTFAGLGVAFRRHDPSLAGAPGCPDGMVEFQAGQPVWTDEAEAFNSTGTETLAVSYAIHVAMVELYRLEARLEVEEKKKRQEKGERKAREWEERLARKAAKRNRKVAKKERRKRRDAKRTKERRREKKAERKERRMARRERKRLKTAVKLKQRRTKVTVKIFDDSMGALLMLDGQLPITTAGLRMAAMDAIKQSMELERRFVNRSVSSALMDVSLELYWVPGHSKRLPQLHRKAEHEAQYACKWGRPSEWFDDMNGDLPECDEPAVSLLFEHIGDLPQQPLSR